MTLDGAVILAVDDNPANLDIVTRFLGELGCRVLVSRDGERAIERALRTTPELILLDVKMPGLDGFEVCDRIKRHEELRDIPVVFVTALTDEASKVRAFEMGGVDYITKPIGRGELIGRVSAHLENARYRRGLEAEVQRHTEELRRELREKELLVREVHHRVKNNLSVVSSLLRLQLAGVEEGGDPVGALAASAERIHAMASVHQQIYETGRFSDLDLADYVESLVPELQASYDPRQRIRVSVDTESVIVDVGVAVPCGIIINELVTNALKHAFPDGAAGLVTVQVRCEESGWFRLGVADDGIGFDLDSYDERSATLGITLVRTLASQLRGELTADGTGGTSIELRIPPPGSGV